jgi:hypothetical protein
MTACEKMADWLADKLKKNDANVKLKTLLVIKQVRTGAAPTGLQGGR